MDITQVNITCMYFYIRTYIHTYIHTLHVCMYVCMYGTAVSVMASTCGLLTLTSLLLLAAIINISSTHHFDTSLRVLSAKACKLRKTVNTASSMCAVSKTCRLLPTASRPAFFYIALVLLVNSNDVQLNPGPNRSLHKLHDESSTMYLCGGCK